MSLSKRVASGEPSISSPKLPGTCSLRSGMQAMDSAGVLHGFNPDGSGAVTSTFPAGDYHALAGLVVGGVNQVAAVDSLGRVARAPVTGGAAVPLNPLWGDWTFGANEKFSLAVSDFDRDGQDDAFLLGSKGSAGIFQVRADKQGQALMGWPQILPRSVAESRNGPNDRREVFDYGTDQQTINTCGYLDRLNN